VIWYHTRTFDLRIIKDTIVKAVYNVDIDNLQSVSFCVNLQACRTLLAIQWQLRLNNKTNILIDLAIYNNRKAKHI